LADGLDGGADALGDFVALRAALALGKQVDLDVGFVRSAPEK